MRRFYLDTSIWRDYFEDRKDNMRPLGDFAFRFLKECKKRKFVVFVTDIVIAELHEHLSKEQVNEVFSYFKKIIVKVKSLDKQIVESKTLALKRKQSHRSDVLHAIIARDKKAILITRDAHFDCLQDIVQVMKPEEVIFD